MQRLFVTRVDKRQKKRVNETKMTYLLSKKDPIIIDKKLSASEEASILLEINLELRRAQDDEAINEIRINMMLGEERNLRQIAVNRDFTRDEDEKLRKKKTCYVLLVKLV